jgi:hypothetical protein
VSAASVKMIYNNSKSEKPPFGKKCRALLFPPGERVSESPGVCCESEETKEFFEGLNRGRKSYRINKKKETENFKLRK